MGLSLAGQCNRCTLCCFVKIGGETFKCGYLKLYKGKQPGEPMAGECMLHSLRTDGMPIPLLDQLGHVRGETTCHKNTWLETEAIIEKGIGKGCSLKVVFDGKQMEAGDGKFCDASGG